MHCGSDFFPASSWRISHKPIICEAVALVTPAARTSSITSRDPASGVSFSYLTNFVAPDPWHSARLDRISNLVHAAID